MDKTFQMVHVTSVQEIELPMVFNSQAWYTIQNAEIKKKSNIWNVYKVSLPKQRSPWNLKILLQISEPECVHKLQAAFAVLALEGTVTMVSMLFAKMKMHC